jgi:hypothetical protein
MKENYTYEQALKQDNFADLSPEDFCTLIGTLIDSGFDRKEISGVEKGVSLAQNKLADDFDDYWKAVLYYYTANGWASLRQLRSPAGPDNNFLLESEETEQEILHLRKAVLLAEKFDNRHLMVQILTNLANAMNHVGRFIEAIHYWHLALTIVPGFGMAIGNLGFGLAHYAQVLYDEGHRSIFCKFAYNYLLEGAMNEQVYAEARNSFNETAKILLDRYGHDNLVAGVDLNSYSLGQSKVEKEYRQWCIQNSLFLNPLNDFVFDKIVSHDCFFLPSITANLDEPPLYHAIYNQLKQEYATARYLLYEGVSESKLHFSDKGNLQVDTLDYAVYSFRSEKIKIAFRLCYSIFDKIAYLLNDYLEVGLQPNEVNFRKVWYQKGNRKPPQLNERLMNRQNWPLRGLFWLSKDLTIADSEFSSNILPESTQLVAIRNFIEHKSFMITHLGDSKRIHGGMTFQITREDLIDKTLVVMKMARAAMMYVSFAIHIEERKTEHEQTIPWYMPEILQQFKT